MNPNIDTHIIEKIGLSKSNILLFYKGVMNNMVLSVFTQYVENIISPYPKLTRKVNRALIELAQNISYYSEEKSKCLEENKGVGMIIIKEYDDSFVVIAGNKVKKEKGKELLSKCSFINSLDILKLREYKAKQRKDAGLFENRCNIGLVQVAIVSTNDLEPQLFMDKNGYSYYILNAKFNKDS